MTTTTSPNWLETLRQQNNGEVFTFEPEESTETLQIAMLPIITFSHVTLDLTTVPEGWKVRLWRQPVPRSVGLVLEGVRPDIVLSITVDPGPAFEIKTGQVLGRLLIRRVGGQTERPDVTLIATEVHRLLVRDCNLNVYADVVDRLGLVNSGLGPYGPPDGSPPRCPVAELAVQGECVLAAGVEISRLMLGSGVKLGLPANWTTSIPTLVPLPDSDTSSGMAESEPPLLSANPPEGACYVEVTRIEPGLSLWLASATTLLIGQTAERLEVRGGQLTIRPNAAVEGLALRDRPHLIVEPRAVVTAATGEVIVDHVRHAHLVGARDSPVRLIEINEDMTGATLENVEIPNSLAGRQALVPIEQAAHFTPYIGNLPTAALEPYKVWHPRQPQRLRRTLGLLLRSQRPVSDADLAKLTNDYEYVRTMARIAASRGAPGAVRTKLAWSTYRLRNLVVGKWERYALSVYRLIGYGERPVPAIITWIAIAALVIPLRYGLSPDLSPAGLGHLLGHWADNMLSPLHLLRLGGSDEDDGNHWHLLAKILVAAPFVTAVLAARKYLKGERDIL